GKKTAQMATDVLKGKTISEVPVATLDNFQKVINKTTANSIGAPSEALNAIVVE
ncbi:MAG: ABC transporter substrate binding protein, partial [Cellulosilyticaceae bacterium]